MTEAPGAKMLKIAGIVLLAWSGIALIFGFIACAGAGLVASALAMVGIGSGSFMVTIWVGLALAVVGVLLGLLGILWSNNTAKAGTITLIALVYIALLVVRTIFDFISASALATLPGMTAGIGAMSWVALILGLVLPVLIILAAKKNKAA